MSRRGDVYPLSLTLRPRRDYLSVLAPAVFVLPGFFSSVISARSGIQRQYVNVDPRRFSSARYVRSWMLVRVRVTVCH